MEPFSLVPSAPISHQVELYTARFFVQGTISGPFKRTSDLLNRKDTSFVRVDSATIAPVGQAVDTKPMSTPLMVIRSQIHFAAGVSGPQQGSENAAAEQ